ncbi:hypothetical protein C6499_22525 [Candidatus Poribacteria bacterium]|nr:MAG: hypothetical protein C6499_22525 [Candidatus Poribacteria bacterium]
MGFVYMITNDINSKAYIGICIHPPEKTRIKAHLSGRGNQGIADDINIYGKDAFTYEILEANVFDELLPDLEKAYIAKFKTVHPHGYNLTSGGEAAKTISDETRCKISEAHKGKSLSAEHRRKISQGGKGRKFLIGHRRKLSEAMKGEKNHQFGETHSEETRRKMSEAQKGKKNHFYGKTLSEEHRRKISQANKGRKHSEESLRKMSEAQKGRTLSAEHRRKISQALTGEKHPNLHPEHIRARNYFFSLPSAMPLKERRKLLRTAFRNIHRNTIYHWVRKWTSTA